jgi:non-heme Fe2+,alpha-ketoglutarate-dependent halogenase
VNALPKADIDAYVRDGILAPYEVLNAAEIDGVLDTIGRIDAQPADIRKGLLGHKTHLASARLAAICAKPEIVDRVQSLLGPDILVWGASFFLKEPNSPAFVSWHQDATYWGLGPSDIVTAWVAITPSTRRSGCLRVVPGSHDWPIVAHTETFAADNLLSRGQEIAVAVDPATVRDILLAPGEMSLHHVKIAHNSEPNGSDHRRIGFAIRYVAARVRPQSRDQAMRVRGDSCWVNFDPEEPGRGELEPADLARHAASLAGNRIAPMAR